MLSLALCDAAFEKRAPPAFPSQTWLVVWTLCVPNKGWDFPLLPFQNKGPLSQLHSLLHIPSLEQVIPKRGSQVPGGGTAGQPMRCVTRCWIPSLGAAAGCCCFASLPGTAGCFFPTLGGTL